MLSFRGKRSIKYTRPNLIYLNALTGCPRLAGTFRVKPVLPLAKLKPNRVNGAGCASHPGVKSHFLKRKKPFLRVLLEGWR